MPESKCHKTQCQWQESHTVVVQVHFLSKFNLIWPRSSLKTTKMSKKRLFAKSSGSQWVKHNAKNILIQFFTSRVCSQSTLILFLEQIAPLPAAHAHTCCEDFCGYQAQGNGVRNSRNLLCSWPTTQRVYVCWSFA